MIVPGAFGCLDGSPSCLSVLMLSMAILVSACDFVGYESHGGSTMGTYYRVVADCRRPPSQSMIEEVLNTVDEVMSNYRLDSQVQQFNRSQEDAWIAVDESLVHVVAVAREVSELTSGRFDISIEPLVAAWGFGSEQVGSKPSDEEVERLLRHVDFRALEFQRNPPSLRKRQPLTIDLSGIAKGYGVDALAELLEQSNCQNYLVEIGGELRVRGVNQLGRPWQIGIETPTGRGGVAAKITLTEGALATTGDYRNFRVFDDKTYPHVLDAVSGYPVNHKVASVTVQMPTATEADAFATALYILGEEGYERAKMDGIAALFFIWDEHSEHLVQRTTAKMEQVIED